MTVDQLIDKLAKPTMVLRFARANKQGTDRQLIARSEVADRAREEIEAVLNEYINSRPDVVRGIICPQATGHKGVEGPTGAA